MTKFCLYCNKQVQNHLLHRHGSVITISRHEFIKLKKASFSDLLEQNKGVIHCKVVDSKTMSFYCPWCQRDHRHSRDDGHRISHCYDGDSPLESYFVKELPTYSK